MFELNIATGLVEAESHVSPAAVLYTFGRIVEDARVNEVPVLESAYGSMQYLTNVAAVNELELHAPDS